MKADLPIKMIKFSEDIYESSFEASKDKKGLMFQRGKWYKVLYQNSFNIIFLHTEKGEKVGLAYDDFRKKSLVQY